ncbi:MAG: ATP-binding cassette domain-containing protein [Pseudomonadota bacterium]
MSEQESAAVAVDAQDLSFRYGSEQILQIEHLRVEQGESVAILGPSGCGKTTLLHLLAGLLSPTTGQVTLLGQDLATLSPAALDRFRGARLGMVFQRLFLLRALTVRANVQLAQTLARSAADPTAVEALLEQLDLLGVAGHRPAAISQGQAQRVAIARALIHQPKILLADEPTSALDGPNAQRVLSLLRDAAQRSGAALLVVTHDERVRGQLDREFELEQRS